METKKELIEQIDFYHSFMVRVGHAITSESMSLTEQLDYIKLMYAKMIWADLWDDKKDSILQSLEKKI